MFGRGVARALGAALLVPLVCPAAADARPSRRPAPLAADAPGFGSFTPAAADPRVAAAFARSGLGTGNFSAGAFRYTPSGKNAKGRAVTVAVRARTARGNARVPALATAAATQPTAIAPVAYSLGASLGWKRFALSGDVTRLDGGLSPLGRESADVGLSFSGRRWATRLDVAGERSSGSHAPALGVDQSWSVGLGGSYAVTRNLDVTGGVRYKTQTDQLMSFLNDRRDGQSVYFGTTFRF